MTISSTVKQCVQQMTLGQVFGYGDIAVYQDAPSAVVKAMGRLLKAGEIKRLSKGRFYKPKQGILGELKPSDSELLKTILYKGGQLRGYVTGTALYNQLGLTTQLPRTITVAIEGGRQEKDFGTLKAKLIKSRAPVKASDVVLLQYLDVLRGINDIPDADTNDSLKRMADKFLVLDAGQLKRIQSLAIKYYTAATRAVLGLILDFNGQCIAPSLKASLNPLSRYSMDIDPVQWLNKADWYIRSNREPDLINKQVLSKKMDSLIEKYRNQILSLAKENGVRNVRVFGSMARNEAAPDSDLDLLVDLEKGKSGLALGGFLVDISELIHRKVDVVTEKSLHPRIKNKVLHEARAL